VPTVQGDNYKPDGNWNFLIDPDKKIGYVRLTAFSRNTGTELKKALNELKAQGMKGLVLDLRFNPGGLLTTAVEVADLFLEEGKIVSTKGRNTEERTQFAKRSGTFSGFPMAVLVNRFSASASEIVSAALQDHKRAIVVGERTWGKGSVQNVIELEGGKSQLKLTTASYHRPSGKNIHRFPDSKESDEWGVMPDDNYGVRFSPEEMSGYQEYRRQRDVLSKDGPPKSNFIDRQLARAEEYVTEQITGEKKPDATAKADAGKPADHSTAKPSDKSPEKKPEAKDEGSKPEAKGSKDEARVRDRRLEWSRQTAA
jgi:carboxyl-terminal processing protease